MKKRLRKEPLILGVVAATPVSIDGIRRPAVACHSCGIGGAACAPNRSAFSANCPKKSGDNTRRSEMACLHVLTSLLPFLARWFLGFRRAELFGQAVGRFFKATAE